MQSKINIGLFGHVDHGKTTLVKQLTGKWTDTHSEELKRGISIRVGYADANIYHFKEGKDNKDGKEGDYFWTAKKHPKTHAVGELKRKISFVDSPGHESLMANAIAASSIIDAALFLVAANEKFPQEQTKEHLEILKLMGLKNLIIVQTKLDLVSKEKAVENYNQIKEYAKSVLGFVPPIIPVSASHSLNIDKLIKAIEIYFPSAHKDLTKPFLAYVLRSFDVNKPGSEIEKLVGGVLGVVIVQGKAKKGDEISIFPGVFGEKGMTTQLKTKISKIMAESEEMQEAEPGGLIALATLLDPAITKSDSLAGEIVVDSGRAKDMKVYNSIKIKYELIKRQDFENPLMRKDEPLLMNINTTTTAGIITELSKGKAEVVLKKPIACFGNERIAISRRIGERWRLSAIGTLVQ